jgi:hypothetical protein
MKSLRSMEQILQDCLSYLQLLQKEILSGVMREQKDHTDSLIEFGDLLMR